MAIVGSKHWNYQQCKSWVQGQSLPLLLVSMDSFHRNIDKIASIAKEKNKKVRIATKSLRIPELISLIMKQEPNVFQGLMCYSSEEIDYFASLGIDDLLLAYPATQEKDLDIFWNQTQQHKKITWMVDGIEQIEQIESFAKRHKTPSSQKLRLCIDIDVSTRWFGQHWGVQRSSVRNIPTLKKRIQRIQTSNFLTFVGIMTYEAQISSLGEENPTTPWLNPIKKQLKKQFIRDVFQKRQKIATFLRNEKIELDFWNAGGTGSFLSTCQENDITEVTLGSGFLQSHLFDAFEDNFREPAICFALPITRLPEQGIVVCQSGGFVASGETSQDKTPQPFLPSSMQSLPIEGFGEVQTPLRNFSQTTFSLGDPIFFRPAKSGEISERFQEVLLIQNNEVWKKTKTYRGLGFSFY